MVPVILGQRLLAGSVPALLGSRRGPDRREDTRRRPAPDSAAPTSGQDGRWPSKSVKLRLKPVIETGATVTDRLFGSESRRVLVTQLVTHQAASVAAWRKPPGQTGGPKWT